MQENNKNVGTLTADSFSNVLRALAITTKKKTQKLPTFQRIHRKLC